VQVKSKPALQLWLPLEIKGDLFAMQIDPETLAMGGLMERILMRENLLRALRQVERNNGAPGIDGMPVKKLRKYLKKHWPEIRDALLNGSYYPSPVKRVEIPKPGGGTRNLGIPTALDRWIQQAVLQVLQSRWDRDFSTSSYGFRPGRSAHQAVKRAQAHIRAGYCWIVDIDLEKFFDRVNQNRLMSEIRKRISDSRVLSLIHKYLKSGVLIDDALHETHEGTPQGGPLSPLLSNLLLDCLDKELEKRGHRFVRYADDCNIYVRSQRAAIRVLQSVTHFLNTRLKLKVNEAKSAVGRPWERQFLGFSFTSRNKRRLSLKAVRRFKTRVRELTRRTRGRTIMTIVKELRDYLTGWYTYFGIVETQSPFKELDSWIRRKLRCYLWKQWGRRGYKELRKRGISVRLAWNTSKSAHGPWRLSRSPGLAIALPGGYFDSLGLPRLYKRLA